MTVIALTNFGGKAPRIDPQQLPDNAAQTATNTKTWRRVLQPFRAGLNVATMTRTGTVKTIYRFNGSPDETTAWLGWAADVNVVRGQIAGDTSERTYFTGDGVPKVTDMTMALTGPGPYPAASYTLAVPRPTVVPGVSVTGTGTGTAESWAYTYTFVTEWGEESGPYNGSNVPVVQVAPGQTVTIDGLQGNPGGARNINRKRLYRSTVGSSGGTAYQLCKVKLLDNSEVYDIPIGATTVYDISSSSTLGEALETMDYDEPPADLFGLIALPGGAMAGLSKNEVCFCEPFAPYAWPSKYRLALDFDAVGLGAFGTTVVAVTKGNPYLISGSEPASMSMQKSELKQACVSKRGIVETGDAVLYPSPDGLVSVGMGGVTLISDSVMTRDDWQALNPSSITAFLHEGRYYGFYDTGSKQGGFVFDMANRAYYDIDVYATAGHVNLLQDALYLQIGNNISRWEGGTSKLTYTWKSKKFVVPKPTNFSCGIVQAATYPLTLKVYGDGVLKHTATVSNGNIFRLPSGYMAKTWEFEITGTSDVLSVHIASSASELREVAG